MDKEDDEVFFVTENLYVKRRVERNSDGEPLLTTYQQALDLAAKAGEGWRLLAVGEVFGLSGSELGDAWYSSWASAPVSGEEDHVWGVGLGGGLVLFDRRSGVNYVRLVRSGPVSV